MLPKLNAGPAALISLGLFVVVFATEIGLMASQAIWLKLMGAATLLVIGHVLLTTKRFLVTEATKRRLDYDSAQSNKQLALKFQKEGELDMALEYFRRCPVDESLLEAVYILAGDFERKRQFNKAGAAYEYIAAKNPNFRDIKQQGQSRQAVERHRHHRRFGGGGHGRQHHVARWQHLQAHARPLRSREGARQGRDGRGVSRQGSQDQPRGGDQDHGAVAGIRSRQRTEPK
jgi:ABC-type nickel/cobalt efflux system permease component RcnA